MYTENLSSTLLIKNADTDYCNKSIFYSSIAFKKICSVKNSIIFVK